MCTSLRVATRAVTRLYSAELREAGIEATQYTILQILEGAGPLSQGRLGEVLAAEKTTMSRNLKLLEKRKWIQAEMGEDRRERIVRITEPGRKQLARARGSWERAQVRVKELLTPAKFQALRELLAVAAETAVGA